MASRLARRRSPPSPPRSRRSRSRSYTLAERDEVAALRAARLPHRRRRLDGPRRLGQRAARHHRDQPLLRAHDVQGHPTTIGTKDIDDGPALIDEQEKRPRGDARGDGADAGELAPRRDRRPAEAREPDRRATASSRSSSTRSSQKQREIIVKDEFDQIYTAERRRGPERLHLRRTRPPTSCASRRTSWSSGPGWSPTGSLNPVFREFYSERDVVFEERRLRTESTPLGKFDEDVQRPVLGGAPLQLAGGGLALGHPDVHARPGRASTSPPTTPPTTSPASSSATFERGRGEAAPRALLRPPPARNGRAAAGGDARAEAARREALQRRGRDLAHRAHLVEGGALRAPGRPGSRPPVRRPQRPHRAALQEPGAGPAARQRGLRLASTRSGTAASSRSRCTVKDGKEPAAVEAAVYEEIEKLQKEPVPAEELQKVKNQDKANAFRRLSSPFFDHVPAPGLRRARRLEDINTYADRVDAVTAADVQRVAQRVPDQGEPHRRHLPAQGRGRRAEDPEIAKLPAAGAGHGPAGLEADRGGDGPGEAPADGWTRCSRWLPRCRPEMKPAFELILKRAEERLDALAGEKK